MNDPSVEDILIKCPTISCLKVLENCTVHTDRGWNFLEYRSDYRQLQIKLWDFQL